MKIKSMTLNNFRQFHGIQKLEFSQNSKQRITVIHGENGSGKTALLNAFKWILYGKTDFEAKNKLINERYLSETEKNAEMMISISLQFEHEGIEYDAKRYQKFRKTGHLEHKAIGENYVELSYIDKTGEHIKSHNASTHIKQIMPEDLHSYFFFNGERIDTLANESSSEEIKTAIKKLLGLEILERADLHLQKYVIRSLKKNLKDVSSSDLGDKLDHEGEITDKQTELKNNLNRINKNLAEFKKELKVLNSSMEEKKEVAMLQKERLSLEERNSKLSEDKKSILKQRRILLSNNAYLAFTENVVNHAKEILEEKRKKGELPSNIKQQFVKDLLERKYCICGRDLQSDSVPYKSIEDFLSKTVPQDVEDAYIKTTAAISGMQKARKELFVKLSEFQNRISDLSKDISVNQARIDVISDKIGNVKIESIEKMESRRTILNHNIRECDNEIHAIKSRDLPSLEDELNTVKKEIKDIRANNEKQAIAQKRLEQAKECRRVIISIHETISDDIRKRLSKRVNDTFSTIMRKNYWAEIGPDYSLDIIKKVGDHDQKVSEKSTGENQVASLSFISSLVSICKDNYESQRNKYLKGGIYPIVMDSPYGTLDSDYRRLVARTIPELADQIIVMLSSTQWNDEVEQELAPRIGKEYTLLYHTPHPKKESDIVIKSDKYEYTEIKEGHYGR